MSSTECYKSRWSLPSNDRKIIHLSPVVFINVFISLEKSYHAEWRNNLYSFVTSISTASACPKVSAAKVKCNGGKGEIDLGTVQHVTGLTGKSGPAKDDVTIEYSIDGTSYTTFTILNEPVVSGKESKYAYPLWYWRLILPTQNAKKTLKGLKPWYMGTPWKLFNEYRQGLNGFQKSRHPCSLDKGILIIGRRYGQYSNTPFVFSYTLT